MSNKFHLEALAKRIERLQTPDKLRLAAKILEETNDVDMALAVISQAVEHLNVRAKSLGVLATRTRETGAAMIHPPSQETPRSEALTEWRCFHCDEVFTDKNEAREHFGDYIEDSPLCLIKGEDGGLAKRVRELEVEVADVLNQRNEYENDARLWHESESDRKRRIGNIQWWQELDSKEGERIALTEEVERLRAAIAEAKDDAPGHCENCRAAVPLTTVHLCATCLPAAPSEHRAALAEVGRSPLRAPQEVK